MDMFSSEQNHGYTTQYKVSKSEMKNALMMYLQSVGCCVKSVEEVSDSPEVGRHACLMGSDILYNLDKRVFQYNGSQVFYYYCHNCGIVRVYFDTM